MLSAFIFTCFLNSSVIDYFLNILKIIISTDVPQPPSGLKAEKYSSRWIFIEWNPSDRADSYVVRYRRVRSHVEPKAEHKIKHNYFNITKLSPYVKYEIYVQAKNVQGLSKNSAAILVETSEEGQFVYAIQQINYYLFFSFLLLYFFSPFL